jgi:hypothetical protein
MTTAADSIVPNARAYTLDEPLPAVLRRYTERTGIQPALALVHRDDRDAILAHPAMTCITVMVTSHGGPHPGEIWLQ